MGGTLAEGELAKLMLTDPVGFRNTAKILGLNGVPAKRSLDSIVSEAETAGGYLIDGKVGVQTSFGFSIRRAGQAVFGALARVRRNIRGAGITYKLES
jgi:hypothetical protein